MSKKDIQYGQVKKKTHVFVFIVTSYVGALSTQKMECPWALNQGLKKRDALELQIQELKKQETPEP